MNETDAIRIEEFRQFKKEILNPPPKVLYNSDYGPQRLAVGFYWTVTPTTQTLHPDEAKAAILSRISINHSKEA